MAEAPNVALLPHFLEQVKALSSPTVPAVGQVCLEFHWIGDLVL
jgi:hypothetical protein